MLESVEGGPLKAVRCFYCGMLVRVTDFPENRRCMIPPYHHPHEGDDGFAVPATSPSCEGFRFNGSIEEVNVDEKGSVIF